MKTFNITYPLVDDITKNNFLKTNSVTKDGLISNLTLLLLTNKGERYYYPEYGTNLLKYIFEPNDSLTENDVADDIKLTVKKFIPELTINSVTFNSVENENEISVDIRFTYNEENFTEIGELTIKF